MRLARGPLPRWADILLLPLINIALAFLVVGIIVRIIGVDPFHALDRLVLGAVGSPESIGYTLYYATNFIFSGLAAGLARHPHCHHHHHVQLRRLGVDGLSPGECADRARFDDATKPRFRT